MADRLVSRTFVMRAAFLLIGVTILLVQLIPFDTTPSRWAGPDLLVVLCLVWTIRRPEYAPALSVAALMFLADLLLDRPPGLMALLTVIACEVLRRRSLTLRDASQLNEWMTASIVMLGLFLGYRVLLSLFLLDTAPFVLTVSQLLASIAAYPVVALASWLLTGLEKPAPGDVTTTAGAA